MPEDPSEIPIGVALQWLEAHGVIRIRTEAEGLALIRLKEDNHDDVEQTTRLPNADRQAGAG